MKMKRTRIMTAAVLLAAGALLLEVAHAQQQTRSIDDSHAVIYSQPSTHARTATLSNEILPFRVNVPDDALVDLRKRVLATRWPDKETVGDRSQGVQLAKLQELVRYWGTDYDWRNVEATLNALRSSSRRSMASTFTSSTFDPDIRMPCQSSSPMAGQGP